jgi:hypothetical protein
MVRCILIGFVVIVLGSSLGCSQQGDSPEPARVNIAKRLPPLRVPSNRQ